MRRERRAGLDTAFQTRGTGARPTLMLHCSLASGREWVALMDRLGDGFSMTAIDLPGHGRSGDWAGEGDLLIRSAEVAGTFCDGPTDIVAHSFGAAVALRLAVERPDLIRTMVLVEPVLFAAARGSEEHADHADRFAPFTAALARGDREAATRHFAALWGDGVSWESLPRGQRDAMIARIHLVRDSAPGLEGDSGDVLGTGRLERVAAPVVFVAGAQGNAVIRIVHARLMERLRNAREAVIDGAGHMMPLTHADALARLVRAHLGADQAPASAERNASRSASDDDQSQTSRIGTASSPSPSSDPME